MALFLSRSRSTRAAAAAALLLAGSGTLAACGSDADDAAETTDETTTTEAAMGGGSTESSAAEGVTIDGAWARTSPSMTTAGALYFEVTNHSDTDDVITGVAVDPSIADHAEMHTTTMVDEGDGGMSGGSMDGMSGGSDGGSMSGGMMKMEQVDSIAVPAGETVALQPGSHHVMLIDLVEPLTTGNTIEVTVTFQNAGEVVVKADVRDAAPQS